MAKQLPRCELLKSQLLTEAAASHQQNGADGENIHLTELPREANATACTDVLWELHRACLAMALSFPKLESEQGKEKH